MSSVPPAEVDGQPEQEPEGEHGEEDEEQGLGRAKLEQRCDAAKQEQLNEQEEEGLGATGGGVVVHGAKLRLQGPPQAAESGVRMGRQEVRRGNRPPRRRPSRPGSRTGAQMRST